MSGVLVIAGHALREALRRRVFAVVLGLTVVFGALYAYGVNEVFDSIETLEGNAFLEADQLAGATMLGLAMFGTLFLGVVLAVFLTVGAVRGDAERGLLQPVVVRPLGRPAYLAGRFLAAATVSGGYAAAVFGLAVLLTGWVGDWWPERVLVPMVQLGVAVAIVAALGLLGSIVLGTTANGIVILMLFGAGLLAGLLGQIGDALDVQRLETIADVAAYALPFEALYLDALGRIVAESGGLTDAVVQLGPLGASRPGGAWLWPWVALYCVALAALAVRLFARRDL